MERLRNVDVRSNLGVDSILSFIETSRLVEADHVGRMDGRRYPARNYSWQPEGD